MSASHQPSAIRPLPDPNTEPTLDIPVAGAYLGLGRGGSYKAAKNGFLPTVRISARRLKVPTNELLKMLGIDA